MVAPFLATDLSFKAQFSQAMEKHGIKSAGYVLIDDGDVVDAKEPDSLFQACSFSKPVAAFAILKLIQEGRFDLDTPLFSLIKTWKPAGDDADKITIRQCLDMTSGLGYANPAATYLQSEAIPALDDILQGNAPAKTGLISVVRKPGAHYAYSGAGYMALQKLIEETTGRSFVDFMGEITTLLGMSDSTFACPLDIERKAKVTPGYSADGAINDSGWEVIPTSASGGMWSTPHDIAQFMTALSKIVQGEDGLLSSALVKAMLSPQDTPVFGLGMAIDQANGAFNFRKNGRNNGYWHEFLMFPESGKGAVIMTNSAGGGAFIQEAMALAATHYSWPTYCSDFEECTVKNLSASSELTL